MSLAIALLSAAAVEAAAGAEVRQLALEALRTCRCQTTPPESLAVAATREDWAVLSLPSLPPWVAYGVAFVAAAAILAFIVRDWRDKRRRDVPAGLESLGTGAPAPPQDRALRARALALAAEGAYAEAIHALLLCALDTIAGRARSPWAPALTSREILACARLPPPANHDLEHMVLAVERYHFGGRTASRSDFDACRERLERLSAVPAGGSP